MGGAFMAFQAWSEGSANDPDAIAGKDYSADITNASNHAVRLSWKDAQGSVHHVGPVRVSDAFWSKITENDQLTVHQTPIRVREEDAMARPVLVDDAPEQGWLVRAAMVGGLMLMTVGAGCLFSTARAVGRQR